MTKFPRTAQPGQALARPRIDHSPLALHRGLCELLEVPAWQDQAGIRAYVWNWLRYRPAAAARYADCVQRVAHLILYHLLEPSWHSWTSAWLLMPLFYYAIIPDELHWLLDLAVRLSCWLVFRIQKQPAPDKRVPLAPGVFSAVPRTQSRGINLLPC